MPATLISCQILARIDEIGQVPPEVEVRSLAFFTRLETVLIGRISRARKPLRFNFQLAEGGSTNWTRVITPVDRNSSVQASHGAIIRRFHHMLIDNRYGQGSVYGRKLYGRGLAEHSAERIIVRVVERIFLL
jgi:hypothetical protein